MAFCSNCGQELDGAVRFCSNCGHKIDDDEHELIQRTVGAKGDIGDTDHDSGPSGARGSKDISDERPRAEVTDINIPPGAKVKAKIPKSTQCNVCNIKTDDICFFCEYGICNTHGVKMQIFADNAKFGNVIQSCPECADRKNGKQPTSEEAAEIGFFFKIKPYHEWKVLDQD